jgi:hypothetical protein
MSETRQLSVPTTQFYADTRGRVALVCGYGRDKWLLFIGGSGGAPGEEYFSRFESRGELEERLLAESMLRVTLPVHRAFTAQITPGCCHGG